jgi:hypothetical protein
VDTKLGLPFSKEYLYCGLLDRVKTRGARYFAEYTTPEILIRKRKDIRNTFGTDFFICNILTHFFLSQQ